MKYKLHSHEYGIELLEVLPEASIVFEELLIALENITEDKIKQKYEERLRLNNNDKSISKSLNILLRETLTEQGWLENKKIFDLDVQHYPADWKIDFLYPDIFSLEICFNHKSFTASKLLKPVLASEDNVINKSLQSKLGVIITVTNKLKAAGSFDNSIGTYENFIDYLLPLNKILTTPMIIIGLDTDFEKIID